MTFPSDSGRLRLVGCNSKDVHEGFLTAPSVTTPKLSKTIDARSQ